MAEYLSPGVFIEEVAAQAQTVAEVSTSTAAVVGFAERGETETAQLITNFPQYQSTYGGFNTSGYLPYAAWNFFIQGGARGYFTRVTASGSTAGVVASGAPAAVSGWGVLAGTANYKGLYGNNLRWEVLPPSDGTAATLVGSGTKFDIRVSDTGVEVDRLQNITVTGANVFFATDTARKNIVFTLASGLCPSGTVTLSGGTDGMTNVLTADFIGTSANRKALYSFDSIDEINIVAIPDAVNTGFSWSGTYSGSLSAAVHQGLQTYVDGRKDCFGIIDVPLGLVPSVTTGTGGALQYRYGTAPFSHNSFNSSFVGVYYPHVYFTDPKTSLAKLLPPSTFLPGIFARTDQNRAVWKAPAGIIDGKVNNAIGVEYQVSKGEHNVLNPASINVIRKFARGGIVVWGSRTCATDTNFLYIPVRRLFTMVEESIDEATQIFVFEPNNADTRRAVVSTVNAFLLNIWRQGGLVGEVASEAFFVKCDSENNPPSVERTGKLIVDVGLAAVKPAEFLVFRFQHDTRALDAELAAAGL